FKTTRSVFFKSSHCYFSLFYGLKQRGSKGLRNKMYKMMTIDLVLYAVIMPELPLGLFLIFMLISFLNPFIKYAGILLYFLWKAYILPYVI
ncbi:hypothetical protein M5D96_005446, partial [Drosophila gunungcola]